MIKKTKRMGIKFTKKGTRMKFENKNDHRKNKQQLTE